MKPQYCLSVHDQTKSPALIRLSRRVIDQVEDQVWNLVCQPVERNTRQELCYQMRDQTIAIYCPPRKQTHEKADITFSKLHPTEDG